MYLAAKLFNQLSLFVDHSLGPSSNSVKTLVKLIENGMCVARMNFSHGDHEVSLQMWVVAAVGVVDNLWSAQLLEQYNTQNGFIHVSKKKEEV